MKIDVTTKILVLGLCKQIAVAGHPAHSAARLRIEIDLPRGFNCPYHQNLWQKLRPKFKQTEVWDCPQTSLAASS